MKLDKGICNMGEYLNRYIRSAFQSEQEYQDYINQKTQVQWDRPTSDTFQDICDMEADIDQYGIYGWQKETFMNLFTTYAYEKNHKIDALDRNLRGVAASLREKIKKEPVAQDNPAVQSEKKRSYGNGSVKFLLYLACLSVIFIIILAFDGPFVFVAGFCLMLFTHYLCDLVDKWSAEEEQNKNKSESTPSDQAYRQQNAEPTQNSQKRPVYTKEEESERRKLSAEFAIYRFSQSWIVTAVEVVYTWFFMLYISNGFPWWGAILIGVVAFLIIFIPVINIFHPLIFLSYMVMALALSGWTSSVWFYIQLGALILYVARFTFMVQLNRRDVSRGKVFDEAIRYKINPFKKYLYYGGE